MSQNAKHSRKTANRRSPQKGAASLESIDWLRELLRKARSRCTRTNQAAFTLLVLTVACLALFLYAMADYLVDFPRGIRILLSVGFVVAVVVLVRRYRGIACPKMVDLESVARRIETLCDQQGKSLRSMLICALQFGIEKTQLQSLELKNMTIRIARSKSEARATVSLHNARLLKRALQGIAVVIILYMGWAVFSLSSMRVFVMRAMALNAHYPTATRVVETRFSAAAPARIDFPVVVIAEGELPNVGRLLVRTKSRKRFSLPLERSEENPARYEAFVQTPLESFRFQIRLGDYDGVRHQVEILAPPFMEDATLRVYAPAYLKQDPVSHPFKNLSVIQGSTVFVKAKANRAVAAAALLLGDEVIPMTASGAGYGVDFKADASSRMSIRFVDKRGVSNEDRIAHQLSVVPDALPLVELRSPSPGSCVATLSRLQFDVAASDDHHVGACEIAYTVHRAETDAKGGVSEVVVKRGEIPTSLTGDNRDATARLKMLVSDLGVAAGDRIALTALVSDNCPSHKEPGKSDAVSIHIVSPQKLRGVIAQEQNRVLGLVSKLVSEEQRQAEVIRRRLLDSRE